MDYSIALGVKPMQLDSPMNSLAQMLQIQQAQGANQLNALKMDEYKRSVAEQNQLRQLFASPGFDIAKPEWQQRAVSASPTGGMAFIKNASELAKSGLESDKIKQELASKQAQAHGAVLVSVYDDPSDENINRSLALLDATGQDSSKYRAVFSEIKDPVQRQRLIKGIAFSTEVGRAALEAIQPKTEFKDSGKQLVPVQTNPMAPGYVAPAPITKTTTPGEDQTKATTERGQNMTDRRARELNEITKEGQQTQVVVDPIRGPILVNKGTGVAKNAVGQDGKPLPGEVPAKREANAKSLLPVLDEAEKLIGSATGSQIGNLVDIAAGATGAATGGAKAIARLKVLEGNLMLNQPRMEGPQSDKDVAMYRQMAGQIGDPTVPNAIKRSALQEIRKITERYAGVTSTDIHSQAEAIIRGK